MVLVLQGLALQQRSGFDLQGLLHFRLGLQGRLRTWVLADSEKTRFLLRKFPLRVYIKKTTEKAKKRLPLGYYTSGVGFPINLWGVD